MIFLKLSKDIFNCLKHRGLKHTCEIIFSTVKDRNFDKQYQITTGEAEYESLVTENQQRSKEITMYQPTRAEPLRRLLQELSLEKDYVFVDIGCGKGRALVLAAEYGFKRLKGIELSLSLISQTFENWKEIFPETKKVDLKLVNEDIVDYKILPEDQVFYIYDPFTLNIFKIFLHNLKASLQNSPRKIHLIYHNNLCCEEELRLISKLGLSKVEQYIFSGNRFFVFEK